MSKKTTKLYNTGIVPVIWATTRRGQSLVIQAGKEKEIPSHVAEELMKKYKTLTDKDPSVKPKKEKTKDK